MIYIFFFSKRKKKHGSGLQHSEKHVVPDAGETEEKHTTPSNFQADFFPPHFGAHPLFVFIFIFRCYGLLREKAVPFPSKRN